MIPPFDISERPVATIVENEKDDFLLINGKKFDAFIDDMRCEKCSEFRIYSYQYDAYFCAHCNVWLEDRCPDSTCEFCAERPRVPVPFP
jgi:hypothetical protein